MQGPCPAQPSNTQAKWPTALPYLGDYIIATITPVIILIEAALGLFGETGETGKPPHGTKLSPGAVGAGLGPGPALSKAGSTPQASSLACVSRLIAALLPD